VYRTVGLQAAAVETARLAPGWPAAVRAHKHWPGDQSRNAPQAPACRSQAQQVASFAVLRAVLESVARSAAARSAADAGTLFLKRIVLQGFKSFADRTEFEFGPGLTCLVGPNGCGKSNVVDAVRWVLGEQSARSLRGQTMTDVIFAGSRFRPPANAAQVDLTFADCQGFLQTDQNEITTAMALLKALPLDGAILTGDAIFTQREICRTIRDGDGHYLFVVKDNQPQLKAGIAEAFGGHSPLGPAPRGQRAAA
jgi:hypothetical protein